MIPVSSLAYSVPATKAISVLAVDPELGEGLNDEDLELAQRHALAFTFAISKGQLPPLASPADDDAQVFGLLILSGLVLREVEVAGRETAELLGHGDLIRPWDEDALEPLPGTVRWTVLEPGKVAALDRRFAAVAGRFPTILETLSARAEGRAQLLSLQRALTQIPRVETRVIALLWRLAERWGVVSAEGVQLALPLTHATIAKLVSARRPSVTTALGKLADDGLIEKVPEGYRLLGDPAEFIGAML
mgnify:CR=1 FL=1